MATLVTQAITPAGVVPAALVAAAGGGDQFVNDGKTFLTITNGSGAPITVTVVAQVACDQGTIHSIANSVAAGATERMGPFSNRYTDANGFGQVTYSGVTTLTIGAVSLS